MKKINNTLRKLDNKGFTLVELIIVIAIIAILIAVLAPQYTKYIERARKSNDITTAGNIKQAALTAALDPDNGCSTFKVTWTTSDKTGGITVVSGTWASNAFTADKTSKAAAAQTSIQSVVCGTGATATVPQSKFATTGTTGSATTDAGGNFVLVIADGKVVSNTWNASMGNETGVVANIT